MSVCLFFIFLVLFSLQPNIEFTKQISTVLPPHTHPRARAHTHTYTYTHTHTHSGTATCNVINKRIYSARSAHQ